MKKVDSTNGSVEFLCGIEVTDDHDRTARAVYKNEQGEYFIIESKEYHIGSAYDCVDEYYSIDKSEADFYQKLAIDRERRQKEEAIERERIRLEDKKRMLTSGDDRYFYRKKKSDTVWWLKGTGQKLLLKEIPPVYANSDLP
ncbi:MAG: hypothetical protein K6G22_04595 [Lachnospiraceae bacterium]|nr:hypothetical protein [Lachnospiraceae bacterium]